MNGQDRKALLFAREKEILELQKKNARDDGVFRVLMMSNSACFYYIDELHGLLEAAGIRAEVCNLYRSGGSLDQLWDSFLAGAPEYAFYTMNENGRVKTPDVTLSFALSYAKWNAICLHQGKVYLNRMLDREAAYETCNPYAGDLYALFRRVCPQAALYWNQVWAYQTGFVSEKKGDIPNEAVQEKHHQAIRYVAHRISEEQGVTLIPSGDAWQIARRDPRVGDVLCNRLKDGGDNAHDGDIGGGQYLNAAVWFEVLTGKSVTGNSFRPEYELSEKKIAALQEAAHRAVRAICGEGKKT